jgi:mRNA-degrading endonuclease RelE of RelBE toxin-antitoxin system
MTIIRVEFSAYFEKELKHIHRKYPRVVEDIAALVRDIQDGQLPGDKVPDVGYDVYKVRLRNRSANRGKRGGFRVIYYARRADFVGFISIYFKSEQTDTAPETIRELIRRYENFPKDTDS